jgi:hypothetical protein
MSSATLVSVQEYLATCFRPDREYVDGEIQERNLGEQPHSLILDPETKRAFCYTPGEMHEVLDGVLRTKDPDIEVPLAEIFEA